MVNVNILIHGAWHFMQVGYCRPYHHFIVTASVFEITVIIFLSLDYDLAINIEGSIPNNLAVSIYTDRSPRSFLNLY